MTAIRQSTARTILVGPVLDADGAAKTDEVVANVRVTKNGTVGSAHGSTTLTHNHAGKYRLAMDAGDPDTVGVLEISLNSGTNDMAVARFNVVEEAVFDAMYAASAAGPLQSTTAARKLDVNATGEAGLDLDNTSGTIDAAQLGNDTYDQIVQSSKGVVWYVDKTGNDGNTGKSWGTGRAFLTINAALSAASAGDRIEVGVGTFTESVDATAKDNLHFIGRGAQRTIINHGSITALGVGDYTTVEQLSATGVPAGMSCANRTGVVLRDCEFYGPSDGILASDSVNLLIERCYIWSVWDGMLATGATGLIVNDTVFYSTAETATGTGQAVILGAADGIFTACKLEVHQTTQETTDTKAVRASSVSKSLIFRGCTFISIIDHASSTGDVIGVDFAGNASNEGSLLLQGCTIYTRNDGAGTTIDLAQATAGTLRVEGTLYDSSKTSGTITDVRDTIRDTVTHADYGNAQLVRSTTPANTLDVDANSRVDIGALGGDTDALTVLAAMYGGTIAAGTVTAVTDNGDFTLTSTDLTTNDNDYDAMWLVLLDNNNKFVPRVIGTYTGASKRVQFTGSGLKGAFPQTVQAGDAFAVLAGSV